MVAVPATRTRLSHALTIRVKGRVIGAISQWSPSSTRTVDTEFEIEPNSHGRPVDVIPQDLSERTVRVVRYDLYSKVLEEVFEDFDMGQLTDQFRPFSVRESWGAPGAGLSALVNAGVPLPGPNLSPESLVTGTPVFGSVPTPQFSASGLIGSLLSGASPRIYDYQNCYFTNVGRTIQATGDRVVSVEATLVYLSRIRVV